jgi:hypothetical protein
LKFESKISKWSSRKRFSKNICKLIVKGDKAIRFAVNGAASPTFAATSSGPSTDSLAGL